MATAAKSASTAARKTSGRRDPPAVRLLKQDHREVEGWFDEYDQLEDDADKLELSSPRPRRATRTSTPWATA